VPAKRSQPSPRRLRYSVATSLDGYIARRNGEMDWIVADPAIDFAAMYREYDTAVMGRKTWDAMAAMGGQTAMPGLDVLVFSRTAAAVTRPSLRITNEDHKTLPRSGIIVLSYSVPGGVAPASPIHHLRKSRPRPAAERKTRSRSRKTHPAP